MNFTMIWLIAFVIFLLIELFTMGLATIWFAGGALVAVLLSVFSLPVWMQLLAFFAVTLLLLIFTRPLAVKFFNKNRVRTNVESMVGRQAIVISEIDNIQGIGQVNVGGQEWSARSSRDRKSISVGTVVTIIGVSGVKLIVEEETKTY